MPGDFDDSDVTPLIAKVPKAGPSDQEYKRLALQREADVARLRRLLSQTEAKVRQLQQELSDLRAAWKDRETFFEALQRSLVVLEQKLRRAEDARFKQAGRPLDLEYHEEIVVCQQAPLQLPAWHRTHTLILEGSVGERRIEVMATLDAGKLERRYRLYQQGEYGVAVARMEAAVEAFRCLGFAEFELFGGNLYQKTSAWTTPFTLEQARG